MNHDYDFIIVGGGSAGCVIATRLIEQTQGRVLLLEAGPRDTDPFIHMPAGMREAQKHAWHFESEADPTRGIPAIPIRSGKVLGGGSSINGMVYVRGAPQDYDDWEQLYGCAGWNHEDVLPWFIRAECNQTLSAPLHGTEGHLWVSEHRYRHPLSAAVVRAGQELGYPYVTDLCGATGQEGVGFWQCTVHDGKRGNTAQAYLQRVIDDERLTLLTDALVEKILVEHGQAVGVRYSVKGASTVEARASHEVIVAAGAFGSPKLLMLSGIGPASDLREFGIDVVVDNPQVGRNYQDHLMVALGAETPDIPSLIRESRGLHRVAAGLEWLAFREGAVTSNILESGGFFDVDKDGRIDTQLFVFPFYEGNRNVPQASEEVPDGLALKIGYVRPQSRGQVLLGGANADDPLRLRGNYLSAEGDLEGQVRAVKLALKFFEAPSLKRIIRDTPAHFANDGEIADFVRRNCETIFHPTSTCRMGSTPHDSVVDPQLQVWGIKNLRVADSSVMPHVVAGNTNAPTIMIAERAADLIARGTAQLPQVVAA